jgi:3-oxoacyl-[acyl-carrier protein] reductase
MDLSIKDKLFIVTGASAGLGYAVLQRLLDEGAKVIAVARSGDKLKDIEAKSPGHMVAYAGDLTQDETLDALVSMVGIQQLDGIFVNAGGPPAMSFMETELMDWDRAYHLLFRWKYILVKSFIPKFLKQGYGRILFSESSSVKQPVENLVLSNSLRMAVVGMAKTISEEIASRGVTANVIAPGMHETHAIERLLKKKSEMEGITLDQARAKLIERIKVGRIGDPMDFASLAVWLLSPLSNFVTGQTLTVDGGAVKFSLG